MMYNKRVYDYFFSPRHAGCIIPNAWAVEVKSNQEQQGAMAFSLQRTSDGRIERACFKANGSPYMIASLEWLCRQLVDKTVAHLPEIEYQQIVHELEIPEAHYPTALRVAQIYKEAVFLMKQNMR